MKCIQAKQSIADYLDHQLPEGERDQLEKHCQSCPACREELKEWKRLFSDIHSTAEKKSVPDGLTKTVMDRIKQENIQIQPSLWERFHHILSIPRFSLKWIGAVGTVAAGIALFVNFIWFSPGAIPTGLTEVQFSLRAGVEPLSSVAVVGDFNDWNPKEHLLQDENQDGLWTATLKLEPGRYEYMFILDGQKWVPDPEAYRYVRDGFGNKNAVIEINNCS